MKKLYFFLFAFALLSIGFQSAYTQIFHIQEGFGTVPDGWVVSNTYRTTSASNVNNLYDGDGSIKMKGVESTMETTDYSEVDTLVFWVLPKFVSVILKVDYSTDGGGSWITVDTYEPQAGEVGTYQRRAVSILDLGDVRVKWTAQGGADQDGIFYIDDVMLTKPSAGAGVATLSSISIDSVLMEGFEENTYNYDVELPYGTKEVSVQAVASSLGAKVEITQVADLSGSESDRTATITVTSEDGKATQDYKVLFAISNIYFQEGFTTSGDGAFDLGNYGWESNRTYQSEKNHPAGAPELYPGKAALKFTGTHPTGSNPEDSAVLISPKMVNVGTLTFWVALQKSIGGESLTVSLIKESGKTELWKMETFPTLFEEVKIEIKETDSCQILFESICDVSDDGANRIWLDDMELTAYDPTASVQSFQGNPDVDLYPNPARDILTIEVAEDAYRYVEIHTITGQKLLEQTFRNGRSDFNVESLAKGVYIISLSGKAGRYSTKLIIE